MKTLLVVAISILSLVSGCASCGNSSAGNDLTGQVKKVVHRTPILCGDWWEADLSLGVIRNGVGSVSTADQAFTVENEKDVKVLQQAAEEGAIVHVTYNVQRIALCETDHRLLSVTVEAVPPPSPGSAAGK